MRFPALRLALAVATLAFAGAALVACAGDQRVAVDLSRRVGEGARVAATPAERVYKVGFDPRLDPCEDARIYAPLMDYLSRKTGKRFELRFTKSGENIIDNLGKGVVDFALLGGVSYVRAHEWYGATPLVRGLSAAGSDTYRGAIITQPDSRIRSLAQLRGKSLAFGNESSTQGHLIPQKMLLAAGIRIDDLSHSSYLGSHQAAADAVIAGTFDAGGIQDTLAASLSKEKLVRVLAWSGPYPSSGIASGKSVEASVVAQVREALIEFRPTGADASGLYHWDKTEMAGGFTAVGARDYDAIERDMRLLGMLSRPVTP